MYNGETCEENMRVNAIWRRHLPETDGYLVAGCEDAYFVYKYLDDSDCDGLNSCMFVTRFWSNGSVHWYREYSSSMENFKFVLCTGTRDGGLVCDGNFYLEVLTAKISRDGDLLFAYAAGTGQDYGYQAVESSISDEYYTILSVDYSPYDLGVIKYGNDGTNLWVRKMDISGREAHRTLTPTLEGGVVVMGITEGFDVSGGRDIFSIKWTPEGDIEKILVTGCGTSVSTSINPSHSMTTSMGETVIVGSLTCDPLIPDSSPLVLRISSGFEYEDWFFTLDSSPGSSFKSVVEDHSDGNYMITGWDDGTGFLLKLDRGDGSVHWAKKFPKSVASPFITKLMNDDGYFYLIGVALDDGGEYNYLETFSPLDEYLLSCETEDWEGLSSVNITSSMVTSNSKTLSVSDGIPSYSIISSTSVIDMTGSYNGQHDSEMICSSHGWCNGYEGECSCDRHYYGRNCNVTTCNEVLSNTSEVCSFHNGTCHLYDECGCIEGRAGKDCELIFCYGILNRYYNDTEIETPVCQGHGICLKPDLCICEENYNSTSDCEWSCFGTLQSEDSNKVCSGRGTCVGHNNCSCPENYSSSQDCSTWKCFGVWNYDSENICSGHGNCTEFDMCECEIGYYGRNCSVWNCSDVPVNNVDDDILICSGHGSCVSPGTCECTPHNVYFGDNCENFNCYEVSQNRTEEVCSAHGKCVDFDTCNCSENYVGDQCENWRCFGFLRTDRENVCGGNGVCEDIDVCTCQNGYYSVLCEMWTCGLFFKNDTENVCSGHGTCEDLEDCVCEEKYIGETCESWVCFDKDKNDEEEVCSGGRGECIRPDVCECSSERYYGEECENDFVVLGTVSSAAVVSSVSIVSLIMCLCCGIMFVICCCASCVLCLFFSICVLSGYLYSSQKRVKKFSGLKNIDILMKEQELEEDTSIAHLKFNKSLFEIDYNELKITKILGEGGSNSVVYLSLWKGKKVAFKCFKTKNIFGDQHTFEEFEKEVEILMSVAHPHILRFFGAALNPPRVGIIMEYCEHGDLMQFMDKHSSELKYIFDSSSNISEDFVKEFPLLDKLRMLCEISMAMDYLHSRNIIHRDLKLENVLIDSGLSCKIMDFGLSRIIDQDQNNNKTIRIGTCIYMAPEIVECADYSNKIDVFSFAIAMYIVISEIRSPYGEDCETMGLEFRVCNDENFRPSVENFKEEVSRIHEEKDLEWVVKMVKKNWSADPKERNSFSEISSVIQQKMEEMEPEETIL